jgi:hypothetical protein
MPDRDEKEILIPEVLPPDSGEPRQRPPWNRPPPPPRQKSRPRRPLDRIANVLGPVVSGMILDAFHIEPIKSKFGIVLGAILGFWFARVCNLRLKQCFIIAVISGYYTTLGIGKFLPIATVAGIFFALKNHTDSKETTR